MEEFPSNSQTSQRKKAAPKAEEPEKKITPVVTGEVQRKKKSLGKRFAETFTGADSRSVMDYIIFDVAIPAAKDLFADVVTQGVERKLFGETRSTSRRGASRRGDAPYGHVAYNRYSREPSRRREDPRERGGPSRRARATHDFDEITLATRAEATEVIDALFEIVSKYQVATVRDLYDLVGETADWTDEKWGWESLQGARVARVRNGYLLDLPRPEPID